MAKNTQGTRRAALAHAGACTPLRLKAFLRARELADTVCLKAFLRARELADSLLLLTAPIVPCGVAIG